jgi:HSP20 family protein
VSTPRWDPFDEILAVRESMDRLIRDAFTGLAASGRATGGWQPAADVIDTPDRVLVRVELPGVDPAAIEVSISDERLTVRGRAAGGAVAGARYHLRELRYGAFERVVALPPGVMTDDTTARYRHGVLEVAMRKSGRAPRRAVPIEIEE